MALDTELMKKDISVLAENISPITKLLKLLMKRYQVTEEQAMSMLQNNNELPLQQRVPMEDRDYSTMQDVMPSFESVNPKDNPMLIGPEKTEGLQNLLLRFKNLEARPARNMATGGRVGLADGTMMASAPDAMDERNQVMENIAMQEFGKPLNELSEDEIIQIEMMIDEMVKRKDQPREMAGTDTPIIEMESLEELLKRYREIYGRDPVSMDELKKSMELDRKNREKAADGGRIGLADGTPMKMASMDKDYEQEFMELVERLREAGFSQQEAIEEARKRLSKNMATGGRVGFQTGGTEYLEQRNLPPEFIEAAQRTYLTDLATQAGLPSVTTANVKQPGETDAQFAQRQAQATQFGITKAGMADLAPQVAAQDALQTQAYNLGQTGLGSFQPFLTDATTAAGAATTLTGTGAGTGAGSIESYMSPYQQQVIDTTMADFDRQAQIRANQQAAATLGVPGAFGGGREGVQRAEYQAASDQNRAQTLANLRQTGFSNAAARRQQDLANQMGIANLQGGLGARAQDFSRAQISGLGTLGAAQQSQQQAVLDAQRQAAQMAIQEPRQALDRLGQGIAGVTRGAGNVRLTDSPAAAQSSPLMQALGLGLAGADIYGRIF